MSFSSSPRRLPAEWETQRGVMLTWPHQQSDWAPLLSGVEPVFQSIALEIARREQLLINCASRSQADRLYNRLLRLGAPEPHLHFAVVASNDTWARDHGPITVVEGAQPRLLDFQFNGWGHKYPSDADNAITAELSASGRFGNTPVERVELVLEGGSIESDGQGTLLTTCSCLLHPGRNPGYSRQQLEEELSTLLGVTRILWLQNGALEGDDTDAHIDMLARFCNRSTIAYTACTEVDYVHYQGLKSMQAELQQLNDQNGKPYELVPLPWPAPKYAANGQRLPASYANFLIINGALLVPAYEDDADNAAATLLQQCFPQHEIIQIPCLPLIQQYGSLHCLSMQFPKAVELNEADSG